MERLVQVKVCGITSIEAARAAVDAGADYLGLIFTRSVRRVIPSRAKEFIDEVPANWVGVFSDDDPATIVELADDLDLGVIQLHGEESPDVCEWISENAGRPVWKAFRWEGDPGVIDAYRGVTNRVLFDSGGPRRAGGTGRTLPWNEIAERYPLGIRPLPLILAGGLGPENVGEAITAVAPDCVDASSGLEREPGIKDPVRVSEFVKAAREGLSSADPPVS